MDLPNPQILTLVFSLYKSTLEFIKSTIKKQKRCLKWAAFLFENILTFLALSRFLVLIVYLKLMKFYSLTNAEAGKLASLNNSDCAVFLQAKRTFKGLFTFADFRITSLFLITASAS